MDFCVQIIGNKDLNCRIGITGITGIIGVIGEIGEIGVLVYTFVANGAMLGAVETRSPQTGYLGRTIGAR